MSPLQTGPKRAKIIFWGTSRRSVPYLESLLGASYKISAVLTSPDKKIGRKKVLTPSPVKTAALARQIPVLEVASWRETLEAMKKLSPELGIMAYFGKIIPAEGLKIPRLGILNLHHSLLPVWRGPAPVQSALLAGDKKTGVTILITSDKVDAGAILARAETEIKETDDFLELDQRLAEIGRKLLLETLPKYLAGELKLTAQNENAATYSKIFKTEDGRIDWREGTDKIGRQIRALNPEPGTFTFWQGRRLIISEALLIRRRVFNQNEYPPGSVILDNDGFKISASGGFIVPLKIKLEGKKETTPSAFLKGYPKIIGALLS